MRFRRIPRIALATVVAAFACAQVFPATSSSFTDATTLPDNTITAADDWTAPTITAAVLQKAGGGMVNKIGANGTFYIYANVTDAGSPASGVGTVTANTTNIATVTSATLSSGSYTVSGTSYNYRSALLTAKSTLTTTTYTYSLSVPDVAGNGPTTSSQTINASNATFAPSSFLTTNVVTSGKILATDKMTFTYSSAPDPESLFAGWDGSSKTVNVTLSDGALYGWSSTTQDVIGITDGTGAVTSLGYIVLGGDNVANSKTCTYPSSTIALSGSTYTVTLGATACSGDLKTDTSANVALWYSYNTAFSPFGTASSGATITGTSRVQF